MQIINISKYKLTDDQFEEIQKELFTVSKNYDGGVDFKHFCFKKEIVNLKENILPKLLELCQEYMKFYELYTTQLKNLNICYVSKCDSNFKKDKAFLRRLLNKEKDN